MAADAFRRIAFKEDQLTNESHIELCDIVSTLPIKQFDSKNIKGNEVHRQKLYTETIEEIFYKFYNRSKLSD